MARFEQHDMFRSSGPRRGSPTLLISSIFLGSTLLGSNVMGTAAARAQNAQAAAATGQSDVSDIVVTATKRNETLLNVPIAVTALTRERIERTGSQGFADIVRQVPGLALNDGPVGTQQFAIRGLASENRNVNLQPTVGLYINDFPQADTFAPLGLADINLYDVERVEVLRGPQGTLQGSGALGGVIRVITAKPDVDRVGGSVEFGAATTKGGDPSYSAKGMVNLPLIDGKLAVRGVVAFTRTGGVIDRPIQGRDNTDDVEALNARVAALWAPTDTLQITASFFYNKSDPQDGTLAQIRGPQSASTPTQIVVNAPFVSSNLVPETISDVIKIGSLVIDWDLGPVSLYSATTYQDKVTDRVTDSSPTRSRFSAGFNGTLIPIPNESTFSGETISQELRLASSWDSRFSWLLGGFYVKRKRYLEIYETVPGIATASPALSFQGTDFSVFYQQNIDYEEKAVFGELAYQLTDRLKLSASGRYFSNKSDVVFDNAWFLGQLNNNPQASKEEDFTPRFVATFQPNDDTTLYVSATKGYRVGGPNVALQGVPPTYGPDTVWSYEAGLKARLLDRTLTANIAVFHIDWTGIQLSATRPSPIVPGVNLNYIENGGTARSQGVEFELFARPIPSLEISWASAYIDARATSDNRFVDTARGGIREGDRLPGSPEFTSTLTGQYRHTLSDGVEGYLLVVHQYVGKSYNGFNRNNPQVLAYGDWNQVDLRAGVEFGKLEVAGYVNNIFNSAGLTNIIPGNPQLVGRQRPVTAGVVLRGRF
jgi:iron complex outermembrane recepter protein